jgi:transposase
MLTLPAAIRVYLAPGATDMRKSFDGLSAAAKQVIGKDPLSGHVFVFCNRRRHILKLLCWDGSGFFVVAKRLERGRFHWPPATGPVELRREELLLLLSGIDLSRTRRRRWYERLPGDSAVPRD